MYLHIHRTPNGKIVALCDENMIGKVLEGNGIHMDLDKYRGFYIGERVTETEVRKALVDFASANIVGKESVAIALAMGVAEKSDVMYINKTPYIQIYKI